MADNKSNYRDDSSSLQSDEIGRDDMRSDDSNFDEDSEILEQGA